MAETNFSNQNKETNRRRDPFFTKAVKKPPTQKPKPNPKPTSNNFPVKSSSSEVDADQQPKKKVFDKQKWRQQKYSLKSKVEQWQNRRVQHLRHAYNKEKSRTRAPANFDVQKIYEGAEDEEEEEDAPLEKVDESEERRSKRFEGGDGRPSKEELQKIREEKERARRKKMNERRKILNKKTKKGQPIMRGRMELLLEQIQESMTKS